MKSHIPPWILLRVHLELIQPPTHYIHTCFDCLIDLQKERGTVTLAEPHTTVSVIIPPLSLYSALARRIQLYNRAQVDAAHAEAAALRDQLEATQTWGNQQPRMLVETTEEGRAAEIGCRGGRLCDVERGS